MPVSDDHVAGEPILAADINDLAALANTTETGLAAELTARAAADTALDGRVDTLEAEQGGSRPPSGGAGGVLSGSYPNPGFAADMATQAELNTAISGLSGTYVPLSSVDSSFFVGMTTRAIKTVGTTQALTTPGTHYAITLTTELLDELGVHDNVTNPSRFTFIVACRLELFGQVEYESNSSGGYRAAVIWKNGVGTGTRLGSQLLPAASGVQTRVQVFTGPWDFVPGDYIELGGQHTASGAISVTAANADGGSTWLAAKRVA